MPLTATAVAKAKPRKSQYKLADGGGLALLVVPNGGRYWRLNYRISGKSKTMALGIYPDISLAQARAARDAARQLIAQGLDPLAEKQAAAAQAKLEAADTFRAVAEEWLEKRRREGMAEVTLDKAKWLLSFVFPTLGNRKINSIRTLELLASVRTVEARGRHESARRLRSVCGRVFRYAIATGRAENDPTASLRDALTTPKVRHLAAITDARKVGPLLRAIDGFAGHELTRAALRLAPHVFVRPGELRQAEWQEFELDRALWSIPAAKTKMRRPHFVPLSRQSLDILVELKKLTGRFRFVFPSFQSLSRPMCENTLNGALRRLGYSGDEMTSHGFRAMASTLLNEMRLWHPDAIERQLGHVDSDSVRRAYARGDHWDERVEMMQAWSDYLDRLATDEKTASHDSCHPQVRMQALAPGPLSYFVFDPLRSITYAAGLVAS
jgi:integrase